MGYNNDQFFNLRKSTTNELNNYSLSSNGTRTAGWNTLSDNPEFVYPARVVRVINEKGELESTPLKRGYIRSLTSQAGLTDIPIKKCQFQFNPQNLTQSVSQNPSMLNFLHQDPAQYAQPMMGNVNFTFDLFFDRTMEMNNADSLAATAFNELNPWETGHPSQVGVLRDLGSLYAVIGQGMAEYQSEYVTQALKQTVTVEANTATDAGDENTATQGSEAIANIPEFLANNMGNSAFLLPLPVRVVFSSLYIVEGLVTDSTVVFTKFNTAYVPMQAAVSITMEAKYIGFAQKNTFLTYVLEQRATEEIRQASVQNTVVTGFSDLVSAVRLNLNTTIGPTLTEFRLQGFMDGAASAISGDGDDSVSKMFKDGELQSVELTSTLTAYGPIPESEINPELVTPELLAFIVSRDFGPSGQSFQCSITPDNPGARASTISEWENMVDGAEGTNIKTASFDLDNAYMIYHHTVTVTSTADTSSPIIGTGELYVLATQHSTDTLIPISWPDTVSVPSTAGSGTVAPDNGASATARTQPGSSSSVGSGGSGFRSEAI